MIYVWLVFFLSSFRFPIIITTVVNGLSTQPETDLGIELRAGGPHRRFCMYAHNIIIILFIIIIIISFDKWRLAARKDK